jgi:hypothetical protein
MRTILLAAAVLGALSSPVAARASDGLTLGVRLGLGVPFGSTAAGGGTAASLRDEVELAFPLALEAGARVGPYTLGVLAQYGPAKISEAAPLGSGECVRVGRSCEDAASVRVGAHLLRSFGVAGGGHRPWVGIGAGYEWLRYRYTSFDGATSTVLLRGFEWLNAQGGVDAWTRGKAAVGPYASISLGRFSDGHLAIFGAGELANPRFHAWAQVGIRGTLAL